jgi:PAS domain S-box-containing protein
MRKQSGYTEQELLGMHFGNLVAPNAEFDVNRLFTRLVSAESNLQETHYRTKKGEWKSVALNTYPIYDDNEQVAGIAAIGIDITETKRLNEILIHTQRMDTLGKMASGLAHDFKNVLTIVNGYARLIADKAEDSKLTTWAEAILVAGERATTLTKNLLTFGKGEVVEQKEFVINDLIREVEQMLPPILKSGVMLDVVLPEQACNVLGDSGKIHQCILNLCINARDAMAGRQNSKISIKLTTKSGKHLIAVQDNGTGIPPDIIDKIFDPFFSTKKKGDGTGLGLSVVYGIVKSHNGEIIVNSRPGEGATFTISLPAMKANGAGASQKQKKILILESDEITANYYADILKSSGYEAVSIPDISLAAENLGSNGNSVSATIIALKPDTATVAWRLEHPELKTIWIVDGHVPPVATDAVVSRPVVPAALLDAAKSFVSS